MFSLNQKKVYLQIICQVFSANNKNKMLKMRTLLKQVKREWAAEGEQERTQSFEPLINAVDTLFAEYSMLGEGKESIGKEQFNILVPGCGAGRLPFEFFRR